MEDVAWDYFIRRKLFIIVYTEEPPSAYSIWLRHPQVKAAIVDVALPYSFGLAQ
jgi:hypothetical protein